MGREVDAVDAMEIPRTWKTTVFLSLMPKAGEANLIVTGKGKGKRTTENGRLNHGRGTHPKILSKSSKFHGVAVDRCVSHDETVRCEADAVDAEGFLEPGKQQSSSA
jgi:hypothetical protein